MMFNKPKAFPVGVLVFFFGQVAGQSAFVKCSLVFNLKPLIIPLRTYTHAVNLNLRGQSNYWAAGVISWQCAVLKPRY